MGQKLIHEDTELSGKIQLLPRSVDTALVAKGDGALGFVQGEIVLHPSPEVGSHHSRVPGEGFGGLPLLPAVPVLSRLGQFPVVQGHVGGDSIFQTRVYNPVIVGKSRFVPVPIGIGVDSGPAGGKPIGSHPALTQKGDILGIPVVSIAGNIPGVTVGDLAGGMAEGIPNGGPAAVRGGMALDLADDGQGVHRAVGCAGQGGAEVQ